MWSAVIWASLLATAAFLAGVYLVRLRPGLSGRAGRPLVSFAGGVLLGAAFLHLLPSSAHATEHSQWLALGAFLLLYLVESHALPHFHDADVAHEHPAEPSRTLAVLVMGGFAIHAVFDGLAIAAGYSGGLHVGHASVFAVCAHKLPEGIATIALLLHWRFRLKRVMQLAWALALVTPVAAVAATGWLGAGLTEEHLGMILAVVAGCFLYIGAADLLPEIRREPRASTSLIMLAGVAVMGLLALLH